MARHERFLPARAMPRGDDGELIRDISEDSDDFEEMEDEEEDEDTEDLDEDVMDEG
jgi:hypothetical protein